MGARQFELWTLICIEMVVNAGIGIKVTLATNFKVGSITPDMSIYQKSCSSEETTSLVSMKDEQYNQSCTHPTWRVRIYNSRKLPHRWTGGPGFRKKRNPAEEPE
jgi:hypothetical protein